MTGASGKARVGSLPPRRRPVLQGAYLRGFPAFVLATYLQRQGFAAWLHGLADVHPEYRAELAHVLAELQVAADQFRDLRASQLPDAAADDSAAGGGAAAGRVSVHEVSTEEAARRLGVTPNRVRQLCREGLVEARKVGVTWVVDVASLQLREVA